MVWKVAKDAFFFMSFWQIDKLGHGQLVSAKKMWGLNASSKDCFFVWQIVLYIKGGMSL